MFNEIELSNCPDTYALNCKGYEVKCHKCKANASGKYLLYNPIDKTITPHPASIKQKEGPNYSRRGRVVEKKLIEKKDYMNKTYASGSVAGDGDATIEIPHIGRVNTEIKTRFKDFGKRFTPTTAEIRKGKEQNIKVWYIHSADAQYGFNRVTTVAYVDAYLIGQIMDAIVMAKSTRLQNFEQIRKHAHCSSIFNDGKDFNIFNYQLSIYEIKRGTKPPAGSCWYFTDRMTLLKTPVGDYVLMRVEKFEQLLHFLQNVRID